MTKMIVIGDETTVTGMKLAGLKNCRRATEENVTDVVRNVPHDVDIIVISARLRNKARDALSKMKEKMVIEIPDEEGGGEDMVSRMIRDVIGFETS
ncbi:MAG: V-type ATP synthase subunit F [Candidatus Aenigmarchaeota archaeon]|nr:V-type ATP synthase subunit F [Candidatus Aenigmarchaeota archaeon]